MAGAIQLAQRAEKLMVRLTDTQLYTVIYSYIGAYEKTPSAERK